MLCRRSPRPRTAGSGGLAGRDHRVAALLHRLDDVLVTGAAANVAFEKFTDLAITGLGVVFAQVHGAEHHAWCAEAALQTVALLEGGLHGVQVTRGCGQSFDRGDARAFGLRRQEIA